MKKILDIIGYLWNYIMVIFFFFGTIGIARLFLGFPCLMIIPFTMVYWCIGNELSDEKYYEFVNVQNKLNPLYARGFFRKKKDGIGTKFKWLYCCQVISAILTLCALFYISYSHLSGKRINWVETLIGSFYIVTFVIWFGIRRYYKWCYKNDFRYVQNDDGIWLPFSYIAQPPRWGFYRPFHCQYRIPYTNLKERLYQESQKNGYRYIANYTLNLGEEINVFIRSKDKELDILELIHIQEFADEYLDRFNYVFADVWERYIKARHEFDIAGVTFLLCVDNYNKALKQRLLSLYSVDHRKDRYRLPAVLVYSENCTFDILANHRHSDSRENKYNRMRKELLNMLGISK